VVVVVVVAAAVVVVVAVVGPMPPQLNAPLVHHHHLVVSLPALSWSALSSPPLWPSPPSSASLREDPHTDEQLCTEDEKRAR